MLRDGEMSERFKELVLKTSDSERSRGFESHSLRQIFLRIEFNTLTEPRLEKYSSGRRGAPAKGVGRVTVARVQIPPSPPIHPGTFWFRGFTFLPVCRQRQSNSSTGTGTAAVPVPFSACRRAHRRRVVQAHPLIPLPWGGPGRFVPPAGARQPGIERPPVTQNMTVHPPRRLGGRSDNPRV